MSVLLTNIDQVRAEIMRLENVDVFDGPAWDKVLMALLMDGRVAALSDAERRMQTARGWQAISMAHDFGMPAMVSGFVAVSTETGF